MSYGERPEETVFAVADGRVVGYAGPSFGATEMFVAEEEQGRGIGPELYKAYLCLVRAHRQKSHAT